MTEKEVKDKAEQIIEALNKNNYQPKVVRTII